MSKAIYALVSPEQNRTGEMHIPATQVLKAFIHFMEKDERGRFVPRYVTSEERGFIITANREFEKFIELQKGVKVKYVTVGEIQLSLSRAHLLELKDMENLTEGRLRKFVGQIYPHNNINAKKISDLFSCIKKMRENEEKGKNLFEFLGSNEEYYIQSLNSRLGVWIEMNINNEGNIDAKVSGPLLISKKKHPNQWVEVSWGGKRQKPKNELDNPVLDLNKMAVNE